MSTLKCSSAGLGEVRLLDHLPDVRCLVREDRPLIKLPPVIVLHTMVPTLASVGATRFVQSKAFHGTQFVINILVARWVGPQLVVVELHQQGADAPDGDGAVRVTVDVGPVGQL